MLVRNPSLALSIDASIGGVEHIVDVFSLMVLQVGPLQARNLGK